MRMMNLKRRLISLALCICMVLGLMPGVSGDASAADPVASVTCGGLETTYTSLDEAIKAVEFASAEDNAVVKLLQDMDLGEDFLGIYSGVFTLDLNGKTLSGTSTSDGALHVAGYCDVSIKDSGVGGGISGAFAGIVIDSLHAGVYIYGGSISGDSYGVYTNYGMGGGVTVRGGVITGFEAAIHGTGYTGIEGGVVSGTKYAIIKGGILQISGGSVISDGCAICLDGTLGTISGGSIYGAEYDIYYPGSGVPKILALDENGVGASFPGGISVYGTTLGALLKEGAAYWQGEQMVLPGYYATEIPGGDVTIKAEIAHEGEKIYTNNGADHTYTYSCCGMTDAEPHSYDSTSPTCVCGAPNPDVLVSVTMGGVTTYYRNEFAAFEVVEQATADDHAVIKILQNLDVWRSTITIESGVFTIDLNGKTIIGEKEVFEFRNSDVTIVDSGEGGMIESFTCCILAFDSTVVINGGTVMTASYDSSYGIYACASSIIVNDGAIDGEEYGIYAFENCDIAVYGGTINDGKVEGERGGIYVEKNCNIALYGGEVNAREYGIYALENCDITIYDGKVNGGQSGEYGGIYASENCDIVVYGGEISGASDGVETAGIYAEGNCNIVVCGGKINGRTYGICVFEGCSVTVYDAMMISGFYGVAAVASTVEIHGGMVEGFAYGVIMVDSIEYYNAGSDTVTPESGHYLLISGGVVTGGDCAVYVAQSQSPVTISGGSISGGWSDIVASPDGVNVTLTVGENGTGPVFPGGIKVENATLPEIFGEDFVYWQDGKPVELAQGQTEISGGDVTVKNENMTVNILGDLSGDSDVDAEDLTILARHVAGIELLTGAALTNADVDGDGDVDANDLTQHARYVAGIITDWEEDED